jgi:glutamate synthase (NADPH/NADH) small chain
LFLIPASSAASASIPARANASATRSGGTIQINALERAAVDYSTKRASGITFSSRKTQRIAIVGSGLSSLTVAFDLATKGFSVVLFEAADRLAGRLRELGEERLPQQAIDDDLAVLKDLSVEVRLNARVGEGADAAASLSALTEEFDAVYLGVGPDGAASFAHELALNEDGRIAIDSLTFATSNPKVFAGGSQRYAPAAFSAITSMYDGRYAVLSIERLFQKASLSANRDQQGAFATKLFTSLKGIAPAGATLMAVPEQGYSREEAIAEAERCIHCECLECVKVCEYLAAFKSYPKRYIRELYNNYCIVLGVHMANKLLNSCAECGLCGTVCPEKLDMGDYIRYTRQATVEIDKMPPSVHAFALRDMAFSTGEQFALARHQPGHDASRYVFYPGCQLSASSPNQVFQIYRASAAKTGGRRGPDAGLLRRAGRLVGTRESLQGDDCGGSEAVAGPGIAARHHRLLQLLPGLQELCAHDADRVVMDGARSGWAAGLRHAARGQDYGHSRRLRHAAR